MMKQGASVADRKKARAAQGRLEQAEGSGCWFFEVARAAWMDVGLGQGALVHNG